MPMISEHKLFSYSVSVLRDNKGKRKQMKQMNIRVLADITYSCDRKVKVLFQPDPILYQMIRCLPHKLGEKNLGKILIVKNIFMHLSLYKRSS
jgi:hypothetical protein